jgi:hypothetical protein
VTQRSTLRDKGIHMEKIKRVENGRKKDNTRGNKNKGI